MDESFQSKIRAAYVMFSELESQAREGARYKAGHDVMCGLIEPGDTIAVGHPGGPRGVVLAVNKADTVRPFKIRASWGEDLWGRNVFLVERAKAGLIEDLRREKDTAIERIRELEAELEAARNATAAARHRLGWAADATPVQYLRVGDWVRGLGSGDIGQITEIKGPQCLMVNVNGLIRQKGDRVVRIDGPTPAPEPLRERIRELEAERASEAERREHGKAELQRVLGPTATFTDAIHRIEDLIELEDAIVAANDEAQKHVRTLPGLRFAVSTEKRTAVARLIETMPAKVGRYRRARPRRGSEAIHGVERFAQAMGEAAKAMGRVNTTDAWFVPFGRR